MKLYKNTLIISLVAFFICIILSIVFEFSCISQFKAISFLSAYMIGIACSFIVVIITTFLQFKYEQKKLLNSILSNVQFFFFHYLLVIISLAPDEGIPNKLWEYYYDEIYDGAKKISNDISNVEWFSKKKNRATNNLQRATSKVVIDMVKFADKKSKNTMLSIIDKSWLEEIYDNSMLLVNSDEYVAKEIVKNYESIQCNLQKLKSINNVNKFK